MDLKRLKQERKEGEVFYPYSSHAPFSGSGCFPTLPYFKYHYYDTPANQDLVKKISVTAPLGLAFGFFCGVHDIALYTKPKGAAIVGRALYWLGPPVGVATAFCVGAHVACNIRKKDDSLTHFIGGLAAGSVVGAWRSSIFAGCFWGLMFGGFAITRKLFVDLDIDFMPEFTSNMAGGINRAKFDFTMLRDRPHNWTSDPNKV